MKSTFGEENTKSSLYLLISPTPCSRHTELSLYLKDASAFHKLSDVQKPLVFEVRPGRHEHTAPWGVKAGGWAWRMKDAVEDEAKGAEDPGQRYSADSPTKEPSVDAPITQQTHTCTSHYDFFISLTCGCNGKTIN